MNEMMAEIEVTLRKCVGRRLLQREIAEYLDMSQATASQFQRGNPGSGKMEPTARRVRALHGILTGKQACPEGLGLRGDTMESDWAVLKAFYAGLDREAEKEKEAKRAEKEAKKLAKKAAKTPSLTMAWSLDDVARLARVEEKLDRLLAMFA